MWDCRDTPPRKRHGFSDIGFVSLNVSCFECYSNHEWARFTVILFDRLGCFNAPVPNSESDIRRDVIGTHYRIFSNFQSLHMFQSWSWRKVICQKFVLWFSKMPFMHGQTRGTKTACIFEITFSNDANEQLWLWGILSKFRSKCMRKLRKHDRELFFGSITGALQQHK